MPKGRPFAVNAAGCTQHYRREEQEKENHYLRTNTKTHEAHDPRRRRHRLQDPTPIANRFITSMRDPEETYSLSLSQLPRSKPWTSKDQLKHIEYWTQVKTRSRGSLPSCRRLLVGSSVVDRVSQEGTLQPILQMLPISTFIKSRSKHFLVKAPKIHILH